VVGNPVPGEHHQVARHEPGFPRAHIREFHALKTAPAGHPADHGGRPHRHAPAPRRGHPERGITGVPGPAGDQRDDPRPGVRQGDHGREADVFRAHDQRPSRQPLPRQVHPPLQFPVVITPGGRSPGTRRAVRGRSRQPVASNTARAATVSIPAALVNLTRCGPPPSADRPLVVQSQPVTVPLSGYSYQWASRLANVHVGWWLGWMSFLLLRAARPLP
jgi:hypothetical protein